MGNVTLCLSLVTLAWFNDPSKSGYVADRVDLMEVNHFYDEKGKLVFNQIIFFEWADEHGRYMVRDWKLLKTNAQLPIKDWKTKEYVSVWYDGDLLRVVRCPMVRESWTQYDPELVEREFLPKEHRALLTKPSNLEALRR